MTVTADVVGYDVSPNMHDLRVYCADCVKNGTTHLGKGAQPLYEGDEWGGYYPQCDSCGYELTQLRLVDP